MYRLSNKIKYAQSQANPFQKLAKSLSAGGKNVTYYSLPDLNDPRL